MSVKPLVSRLSLQTKTRERGRISLKRRETQSFPAYCYKAMLLVLSAHREMPRNSTASSASYNL